MKALVRNMKVNGQLPMGFAPDMEFFIGKVIEVKKLSDNTYSGDRWYWKPEWLDFNVNEATANPVPAADQPVKATVKAIAKETRFETPEHFDAFTSEMVNLIGKTITVSPSLNRPGWYRGGLGTGAMQYNFHKSWLEFADLPVKVEIKTVEVEKKLAYGMRIVKTDKTEIRIDSDCLHDLSVMAEMLFKDKSVKNVVVFDKNGVSWFYMKRNQDGTFTKEVRTPEAE